MGLLNSRTTSGWISLFLFESILCSLWSDASNASSHACMCVCVCVRIYIHPPPLPVDPQGRLSAILCHTLYHTAAHVQHNAALCSTLQHSAALCSTLQHSESASVDIKNRSLREHRVDIHACDTATHCNTQQRAATHCNTLQSKE